jgi:hypothetical protein
MRIAPHMAWNFHYYRKIYAAAMVEAGNTEDAKFTLKSAMYQAAVAAVTEGGDANDLIPKCSAKFQTVASTQKTSRWV